MNMKRNLFSFLAVGCVMLSCGALAGEPVKVADIKITFGYSPVAPPLDAGKLPQEVLYPPDKDSKEHGAFANVVAGHISALTVIWADPKHFKTEGQIGEFLRKLLSSANTQTWRYHVWSYGDGVPSVLAEVEHTAGKKGRWVIWCTPNLYWAYHDGNGKWWFGSCLTKDCKTEAPIDWPARAATVKVGMTRVEVEKILPRWNPPTTTYDLYASGFGSDNIITETYRVAEDWRVIATYDVSKGTSLWEPVKVNKIMRSAEDKKLRMAKAASIKVGMTRAEAERNIPAWNSDDRMSRYKGFDNREIYSFADKWADSDGKKLTWSVTLDYDATGGERSLENRVTKPVRIGEPPAHILVMGGQRDKSFIEPLIATLKDRSSIERSSAAIALGRLGDARAVEPLIACFKDADAHMRTVAAIALYHLGAAAFERLIACLKDQDALVRRSAATALLHMRNPRAVEPLINCLKDEDSIVRWRAADALGNLGDIRAAEPLDGCMQDTNMYVRVMAREALRKLNKPETGK